MNEISPPWFSRINIADSENHAVIIGSGLSGSFIAGSLCLRGFTVDMIDKNPEIAGGASGNPAGVFYPGHTGEISAFGRINKSGYLNA